MEKDHAHPAPDRLAHTLDDRILDLAMGGVTPPEEDIRCRKPFRRQAVFRFLQGGTARLDFRIPVQRRGNGAVDRVRVEPGNDRVFLLVNILVPDRDPIGMPSPDIRKIDGSVEPRTETAVKRSRETNTKLQPTTGISVAHDG
ncbi:MAG: hypothetical protein R3C97_13555 [Geminicoccaceae bacterium]